MDIRAIAEYDGTDFYGFQIQPEKPTVQGEIELVLKRIFEEDIRLRYTSRTDKGVHSRGQVISMTIPDYFPAEKIQKTLNDLLPESIIIKDVEPCAAAFNPRYEASAKLYVYSVLNGPISDYRLKNFVWHIPAKINWDIISEALQYLKGEHEFKLFSADSSKDKTVIPILSAGFEKTSKVHEIYIKAPFFLTYMIRYIIGKIVIIGRGKNELDEFISMLNGFGKTCNYCAPSKGLELRKVYFDNL